MKRAIISIVILGLPLVGCRADRGIEIRVLTGARTRVVWCQDTEESGSDIFAQGSRLKLMGLDTDDGLGERAILPEISNYTKPLITPGGSRVVFSNRHKKKVYVVNWDGTGLREIADGMALEVWKDPQSHIEWVYVGTDEAEAKGDAYGTLRRHQIDDPLIHELVWNKAPVNPDSFQISADGSCAGASFPWPNSGVAVLPNESWQQYAKGCWTAFSPDNSYLLWIFDGSHRNVQLYTAQAQQSWRVNINNAPEIDGYEVYHPRWSSHIRFMTMTGPYRAGEGSSRIRAGGVAVEIYLGRFNPTFKTIEKWVKVTTNNKGDFFPDAWIESGEKAVARIQTEVASKEKIDLGSEWPGNTDGLVFLWENGAGQNEIDDPAENRTRTCRADPRGRAKPGRYFGMRLKDGAFAAQDVNDELLAACKKTNQLTVEALITPDNLEQHGPARIISFSTDHGSRNFTLGQDNENLVFRLRTPQTGENGTNPQVNLCNLAARKPHHVIVSYEPGKLTCYLNGKPVFVPPVVKGDFSNWSRQHLIFGDEWSGERDWAGELEGIAIYSRVVGPEEARERYAIYSKRLKKRKPAQQLVVLARLLETTSTPAPESIAPYRRALAVYTYETGKVISGKCSDKKMMVAHWVILDGKVLALAQNQRGKSYRLTLERFDDHPQLEGERLIMDSDEFDLALFYHVDE